MRARKSTQQVLELMLESSDQPAEARALHDLVMDDLGYQLLGAIEAGKVRLSESPDPLLAYTPGMLPADPASWLSTLLLLLPVALAARRRSRSGGHQQPPPPPPKKRSSWSFPLLAAGLTLAAVLVTLGVQSARRAASPPSPVPQVAPSRSPPALPGALLEQMRAQLAQHCPRLAAITRGDGGRPPRLVEQLISLECMGLLCEPPGRPEAGSSSPNRQLQTLCQGISSALKGEMQSVTRSYRLACPEIAVPWAQRTWSPSTELGFYAAVRPCMERICEQMVSAQGIPSKYCTLAADIAQGLGDEGAAARLRQRATALQALDEAQWQELSPEQREQAEIDQDMKVLARRWGEACTQGMRKYCEALASYCRAEGSPPDVCPGEGQAPGARDGAAGRR